MADEGGRAKINLKVVTMDGNEMLFKCRKTTPLQSLMDAFCREQRVFANYVQFKSDEGRCLDGAYTPQEVCGTVAVAAQPQLAPTTPLLPNPLSACAADWVPPTHTHHLIPDCCPLPWLLPGRKGW